VFGIPHDRDGEQLKAVVEAREPVGEVDLRQHLSGRLDPFKMPSVIEFCDELPRDLNGKVLKRRLRDAHWAESGRRI
jgi:long-chain acyl-CoA synthetase